MRGTLRMPKAMVTASKVRSGNGSASALPSTKVTTSSSPRSAARARPTSSMAWLMSATVTRVRVVAGVDHAEGDVAGAAGDVEQRERPVAVRQAAGGFDGRRHQHVLPGAMQARPTSGRSSGRSGRRPNGTRRRPSPACRQAAPRGTEMGVLGHGLYAGRADRPPVRATIARGLPGGYGSPRKR